MPKKFTTENTKAVIAKARKAAAREEELNRKKKEEEDSLWQDDDKNAQKKQQRKEDKEKKRQQSQEKKAQNKALLDEELNSIKGSQKSVAPVKISRAQIMANVEKKATATSSVPKPKIELQQFQEENTNRGSMNEISARSVTEAIEALSLEDTAPDRHPEKRVRAAYLAYEQEQLPILKQEYPTYRFSQLKQLLQAKWKRAPENPYNKSGF